MAKLKDDAIGSRDISEYLREESDFGFEMRVLRTLVELGFSCEHGGSYTDPVTEKVRQFDIRARKNVYSHIEVALSVECKNLRQNYPLLVHRVPRRREEAFHDVVRLEITRYQMIDKKSRRDLEVRRQLATKVYPVGEPVGKKMAQVGRESTGAIKAEDSETFAKMSQSLNAAHQLAKEAASPANPSGMSPLYRVILPVLVVPDRRLWAADYATDGKRKKQARVARSTYYVGHAWKVQPEPVESFPSLAFTVSHVDIVTFSELGAYAEDLGTWRERGLVPVD